MKRKERKSALENISEVMRNFYSLENMTIEKALKLLSPIKEDLELIYSEYSVEEEDYRQGDQTYGYEEEEILGNLQYISDRWGAAFRIAWMIGLIERQETIL